MMDYGQRFLSKFQRGPGCWNWIASKSTPGYGQFFVQGQNLIAHRLAWEMWKGPIPEGKQLDHTCRNRACVNPDHLEVVTLRENILRGNGLAAKNARKKLCLRGHRLSGANVWNWKGQRHCRACWKIRVLK